MAPCLLLTFSSYRTIQSNTEEQLVQQAEASLLQFDTALNGMFLPVLQDATYMADHFNAIPKGEDSPQMRQALMLMDAYEKAHTGAVPYIGFTNEWYTGSGSSGVSSDYSPTERPWYKDAAASKGKVIITDAYPDADLKDASGRPVISVTLAKELANGQGVLGIDFRLDGLRSAAKGVKTGKTGSLIVLDKSGKVLLHPTIMTGEPLDNDLAKALAAKSGTATNGGLRYHFITNEVTGWKVAVSWDTAEISRTAQPLLIRSLLVAAITAAVGIVLALLIVRSITRPLSGLLAAVNAVANGDLTRESRVQGSDEIAQLATGFNRMVGSLRQMASELDSSAATLSSSAGELQQQAEAVSGGSRQNMQAIGETAAGSREQLGMAEETARVMQEVAAGVGRIAEAAAVLTEKAVDVSEQASEGNRKASRSIEQMEEVDAIASQASELLRELNGQSEEIDRIVKLMTDVAEQTNLLALNASIEAARAGEQGKGFAVVAGEVRKLAEHSKQSAGEIRGLIEKIKRTTDQAASVMGRGSEEIRSGSSMVREAGEAFGRIAEAVLFMQDEVREASVLAEQMSASTEEVAAAVENVAHVSRKSTNEFNRVQSSSEQQLLAMERIANSSVQLNEVAGQLQKLVRNFKM